MFLIPFLTFVAVTKHVWEHVVIELVYIMCSAL